MIETGTNMDLYADPVEVKHTIRHAFPLLRHCYEVALRTKPTVSGTVDTTFVIGADGLTRNTSARGARTSLPDDVAVACIERVYACLTFPPFKRAVHVRYPIDFEVDPDDVKPALP